MSCNGIFPHASQKRNTKDVPLHPKPNKIYERPLYYFLIIASILPTRAQTHRNAVDDGKQIPARVYFESGKLHFKTKKPKKFVNIPETDYIATHGNHVPIPIKNPKCHVPEKNRLILLIFSILLFHIGCTTEHATEEKTMQVTDATDKLDHLNWAGLEPHRLYIIRSVDEYKAYRKEESTPLPDIDFKTYSLLIVKGQVNRGISEITKLLIRSETDDYILRIGIILNDALSAEEWHVGIVAPRIRVDKKIELQIESR